VLNRHAFQIDAFETADIDGGHPATLWIGAFAVRVNTAGLAKVVFDDVFVERVGAEVRFRSE
jgi:hypothetical protein